MSVPLKNAVGCGDCAFLSECGGLKELGAFWGCYFKCLSSCDPASCDLTCPSNTRLFLKRLAEIEGTFDASIPNLTVPMLPVPDYVPKIHNGSGRVCTIKKAVAPMVAVPARALLTKQGSCVTCRFRTANELRSYFCISAKVPYIISCISTDDDVEAVWEGIKYGELAKDFAKLKPAAVIVPNFSFFVDDVPRIHTIYNRKRICLAARILSEAGCPVILPLLALTENDWEFWRARLKENPEMTYFAKEFQTGLSGTPAAMDAIQCLARLQDKLGRPLHPIAVAGGPHNSLLQMHFANHTVLDSRPFILATKRHLGVITASGAYEEIPSPTVPGEPIDALLEVNIKQRARYFKRLPICGYP